jgi:predicted ABC-type transport system involved in lysophospholipase L1 biosynthesis ATPase subunit
VLKSVSMAAAGGQTLALVGATGSGKSTCLRLLFRCRLVLCCVLRICDVRCLGAVLHDVGSAVEALQAWARFDIA